MEGIGCQLAATVAIKEPCYNKSMPQTLTIGDLKAHITYWENRGQIDEDTEVIIGKIGTSGMIDGAEVQKKVTDTDIQVMGSETIHPDTIGFTLVHQ